MMKAKFKGMAPLFTTQAGACLTAANWREAGVDVAVFSLASLLMKPGYDVLKTLPNLASYVNWPHRLVLNASMPPMHLNRAIVPPFSTSRGLSAGSSDAQGLLDPADKPRDVGVVGGGHQLPNGLYTIRSQYDGQRLSYSCSDLLALIATLKPTMVVLPVGAWSNQDALLPETIFPFVPVTDLLEGANTNREHGVYFAYDGKLSSLPELLEQLTIHKNKACYVSGELSVPLMQDLIKAGVQIVESDKPASDACSGVVYSSEGDISILDATFEMQFEPIDAGCECPTCSQQFTRAYLHHLLQHTPLLCQRLLVQHNVHYCQMQLGKH